MTVNQKIKESASNRIIYKSSPSTLHILREIWCVQYVQYLGTTGRASVIDSNEDVGVVFTDGKGFVFHPGCLVMVESADEEESDDNEDNDDEGKPGNNHKSRKQTT